MLSRSQKVKFAKQDWFLDKYDNVRGRILNRKFSVPYWLESNKLNE